MKSLLIRFWKWIVSFFRHLFGKSPIEKVKLGSAALEVFGEKPESYISRSSEVPDHIKLMKSTLRPFSWQTRKGRRWNERKNG